MKNADMPINSVVNSNGVPSTAEAVLPSMGTLLVGLTKREYFAGLAMQGFCATGHYANGNDIASDAVKAADALLAALEEQ